VSVLSGTCVVPEPEVDIFWELTPEKTGLIWMKEREVWETEEEEEEKASQQEAQDISMSEPSRIEDFDKPTKRMREDDKVTE
jgi:hypothetical protein